MAYIARSQMELVKGELPIQANEVAVSEYFLSAYGSNAKIGETVRLDTESFHGDYTVTGILSNVGEKEANLCAIAVSKAALTQWAGFDPAGYRAYVHFKNDRQFSQETMAARCREIAAQFGSVHVGMNSNYFFKVHWLCNHLRHSCSCACRRICSHPEYFPYFCKRQNTKLWTAPYHRRNT